jgi:predicted nucleic acid-binding protein
MRLLETIRWEHALVLSEFIVDELKRVLQYPRIQARYNLTVIQAEAFAAQTAAAAWMVATPGMRPAVSSDPGDDPILYTAADGKADILCTLNTRHFTGPKVGAFCAHHGIRVMTDLEALRELGG